MVQKNQIPAMSVKPYAETLEKIITALGIEPKELFDFGHYKDNDILMAEINWMLKNTPEKIPEVYKIVKAIIN